MPRWQPTRPTRTRGEKGAVYPDAEDLPWRGANKVRGHATWNNNCPSILGIVGCETGKVRSDSERNGAGGDLEPTVLEATRPGAVMNIDERGCLPSSRRGWAGPRHRLPSSRAGASGRVTMTERVPPRLPLTASNRGGRRSFHGRGRSWSPPVKLRDSSPPDGGEQASV